MSETWMVAHDFSPSSDAAALEAARLLAPLKGTLRLFHVHAPISSAKVPPQAQWGETTFQLENELRTNLGKIAAGVRAKYPDVTVEVDVASGDPIPGILREALRIGADHIVLGTHGRTGVAHLVLGSVAERVVREAPMPVLVVKAEKR